MESELLIIETEREYLVVWAENPYDWIAVFEKRKGFLAKQWAERMVYLYNIRYCKNYQETVIDNLGHIPSDWAPKIEE